MSCLEDYLASHTGASLTARIHENKLFYFLRDSDGTVMLASADREALESMCRGLLVRELLRTLQPSFVDRLYISCAEVLSRPDGRLNNAAL